MAPHDIYPARGDDCWVAIACRDDRDWDALAAPSIGEPWADDPRFATRDGRLAHEDELDEQMAAWTTPQDKFDGPGARARGRASRAPRCRPRRSGSTTIPARRRGGCGPRSTHREMGRVRVDGLPYHLSRDRLVDRARRAVPRRAQRLRVRRAARAQRARDRRPARRGRHLMPATATRTCGPLPGPLAGLRVVELASEHAAFAGKLLADLGADVMLVEPPGGAPMRRYEPFVDDVADPQRSLWWWHYQAGKTRRRPSTSTTGRRGAVPPAVRGRRRRARGRAAGPARRAGPRRRATCATADDELIWVSVTPFGRDGPRAHEPFTDLTVLAGGGPVWNCGYDDHTLPPVRGGGNQGYQTASLHAVVATLVAVLHRDETRRGPARRRQHARRRERHDRGGVVHLAGGPGDGPAPDVPARGRHPDPGHAHLRPRGPLRPNRHPAAQRQGVPDPPRLARRARARATSSRSRSSSRWA